MVAFRTPAGRRIDQLAYRASQASRHALSDDSYASFFERGAIGPELAAELVRRYEQKRATGQWVPDVGALSTV